MQLIQNITNGPLQTQTIYLPDGSSFTMTLYFVPLQQGWFITSLSYLTFTLQGLRITVSPNMLNQFQNQIPFGLACFSAQNREPSQQNDFSSNACQLLLLNADEVAQYQEFLEGNLSGS